VNDIFNFYKNLLGSDRVDKETLNNYDFKLNKLKDSDKNLYLDKLITLEEAQEVVKNMSDSTPGPNHLTSKFFKKYFES
jgi:hypothetical protein